MAEKRHPGITMHKLSFGGGLEGLTFVIGSTLIFVFGLPALWYFVALAYVLGIGVAIFLRIINQRRSERNNPLSILGAPQPAPDFSAQRRDKHQRLFQIYPRFSSI